MYIEMVDSDIFVLYDFSTQSHHLCREYSKQYLSCRMEHDLMAPEDLNHLGYSVDRSVEGAREYDKSKEMTGFIAGKHISKESHWWWEKSWGRKWSG
jgi:hypothetical protein